jgi:hypothetical protein
MAKRRKSSGTKTITVRERVTPAPIKISVPRAAPIKKRRAGRRRHHSSGGIMSGGTGGSMSPKRSIGLGVGGFLYGYIEKTFGTQIPTVPLIGKSGTIALACYFLGGKSPGLIADVGNAASVIAGYSFGSTGRVSGLAPQVSGIAAQV